MSEFDSVQPVGVSVMPAGVETPTEAAPTPLLETRLLVVPGGKPDLDEDARAIASEAANRGQAIRMRIALGLFMPTSRKQYKHWRAVGWKMSFSGLAEVLAFKADLAQFIDGWFAARRQDQG